jgi:hypothetical protein
MKIPSLAFTSIFLIVLLLNSCSRQQEINYADFPSVKNISFNEHNISAMLGMPMDMVIMNDLIIILDGQTDNFFHVFSKDKFNYLGSAIKHGIGPNEETVIYPYFKNYGNDKILYQCDDNLKIASVIVSNNSFDLVTHKQYDLPTSSLTDADFFIVDDYIFSSVSQRPASKDYFVLNTETSEISEWGKSIPLTNKNINPNLIPTSNQKVTTVNSKDSLIASVFNMLPILRIYSLENESLITQQQMSDASNNHRILLKEPNQNKSKELINYYHRIKSTDDYIYALYGGFSVSDYFKEGETPHVFDFSHEIHIWKWDGTPVMKLKLDRPVFSFDITRDNKRIIATSVVDVEKLFEAEIPWN